MNKEYRMMKEIHIIKFQDYFHLHSSIFLIPCFMFDILLKGRTHDFPLVYAFLPTLKLHTKGNFM